MPVGEGLNTSVGMIARERKKQGICTDMKRRSVETSKLKFTKKIKSSEWKVDRTTIPSLRVSSATALHGPRGPFTGPLPCSR